MSDELTERIKKLDQFFRDYFELTERIEKLEIQVNCLRKQVLDLEGKKSYREQARERSKEDG